METSRPSWSETATRSASELNVFSSSRRERSTASSSRTFSTAADELPSDLVGALEQVHLRSGLEAHLFHDERARARAGVLSAEPSPSPVCAPPASCRSPQSRRARGAARPLRARARRPSGCAAPVRDRRHRKRPRGRPCARADRGATPTCGRRRTDGSRRCRAFRAPRTASSTRRRARRSWSSSRSSSCRSASPLACARSSASANACPTEAASRICCGEGSVSQPMTSMPSGFCICASGTSTAGSVPRYSCAAADDARDVGDELRLFVPEQRLGTPAGRARDRAAGDRRRTPRWPAGCRRSGRTEKGWSCAPRRRTRHGGGAPEAGRSAGRWPSGPGTGWPRVAREVV